MERIFRFQDLEIWKKASAISGRIFDLSDSLEERKKYRFAEQLRAAGLSITNNIAEGSGSDSKLDFKNYLNISRRSVSEVANILIILSDKGYFKADDVKSLLLDLQEESKMITGFMSALTQKKYHRSDFQ